MKVFISHSSKDHDFTMLLAEKMKKDFIDVWVDDWELQAGDSIVQKINEGISKSSFFIIVFSKYSIKSNWVLRELNSTLMRQLTKDDIKILPILLEIEFDDMPPLMSGTYAVRFSRDFINESEYQKLIAPIVEKRESDKLSQYQDSYFENIVHVDVILNRKGLPTRQEVKLILDLIQEKHYYENYFFKKVITLHWFDILKSRGYFKPNPNTQPQETEKNYFRIPKWNVLPYLERVSKQVNIKGNERYINELLEIIREVSEYRNSEGQPIDNYHTWHSFVKILSSLPNNKIPDEIIELISTWLSSRFDTTLPGVEIIRKLLPKFLTSHPEDIKKAEKFIGYITSTKPLIGKEEQKVELSVDPYFLKEGFKKYSEDIGKKCSEKVIKDLEEKIKKILTREEEGTYHSFYEELDYLDEPLDILTFILKRILIAKAKSDINTAQEIIKGFFKNEYLYFPKMALYVIGNVLDKYGEFFWEILDSDVDNIIFKNSSAFGDELKHILENLKELTAEQREILKAKIKDSAKSEDFQENQELYLALHKQRFYKALSYGPFFSRLHTKMKDITKYDVELRSTMGKVEVSSGWGESPLTKEKILQMSNKELAEFLSTFKTTDYWKGPSVNGLSNILKEVVKENPEKFVNDLNPFLKTGYLYVSDILLGIQETWKNNKILDWGKLFEFIRQYITPEDFWNDTYKVKDDVRKANRFWVLGEIGELIKKGTISDSRSFPAKHYPEVQKILFQIIDKMLTDKEELSESQTTRKDFLTYALNSPFGKITEALFALAYRIKKFEKETQHKQSVSWEVNIKDEYELLLENEINESYVRLGQYLRTFYLLLDKEWTEKQVNRISNKKEQLWEAFMQGYLNSNNRISKKVYKLMRPHYVKAIEYQFKEEHLSKRVVDHICLLYLQGIEKIDDENGLFRKILNKWDLFQIREAIGWFWMQRDFIMEPIKDEKQIEEIDRMKKMRELIIDFWRWIYQSKYKEEGLLNEEDKEILSELSKLAVFLEKIDAENYGWLSLSALYIHVDFNAPFFLKYLNGLKDKDKDAGKYVGEIFLNILRNSTPDYDQKDIRSIVEYLCDSDFREYAKKICDIYGKRGYEFLRDIYEVC